VYTEVLTVKEILIEEKKNYVFREKDFDLNLSSILSTPANEEIKFHNPLRNYAHLLAGRLLSKLISMQKVIKSNRKDPTKGGLKELKQLIE
jgi:hypothetical protein